MTELAQPTAVILLGSTNRHKLEEVAAALEGLRLGGGRLSVVGGDRLPWGETVEEDGATFADNARIKARAYAARAAALPPPERPRWVLADDSGLEVDALGGAPGVHSARYAGAGASDRENNQKLLRALEGVPADRRGARFRCVLCLVEVPGAPGEELREVACVAGDCSGVILTKESGQGGFGYDPLFLVERLGKTFAELSREEKNQLSHRGRALQAFRERLATLAVED